ncbi:tRNA (adenine(22)-N(1))-methyltransferase [Clostridiaceae bacterium JG1575]|nr:tRNA (adenine(22)-N(1))-methyltransferase [Clostridiaceae bacterium JG1575]
MKLSKRLEKIVELVPHCKSCADIGTDHGYVALALLERHKVRHMICTDINKKPLEKAISMADSYGLSERIEFRLGPGLTVLREGDASGIVAAGMGGELIKDMIQVSLDLVKTLDFLVLQPAQNPEVLRAYLYDKNFTILSEDLAQEDDGRFYEFFKVQFDGEIMGFSHKPMDFVLSPVLLQNKNPLMRAYITQRIEQMQKIRSKLDLDFAASRIRDRELHRYVDYFQEALKWL